MVFEYPENLKPIYEKAIFFHDIPSIRQMAYAYDFGWYGVSIDKEEAKYWYAFGQKEGIRDYECSWRFGYFLYLEKNYVAAIHCFEHSLMFPLDENTRKTVQNFLDSSKKEYEARVRSLPSLVSQGDSQAMAELGNLYNSSYQDFYPVDYEKGQALLLEAAKKGNTKAIYRLVRFYPNAFSSEEEWRKMMEKGASLNIPYCMSTLASWYRFGMNGYPIDHTQEFLWLKKAADISQNDYDLFSVGLNYYEGNGCEKRYDKAVEYYKKSLMVEKESQFVLYYLGLPYLEGGYQLKQDIQKGLYYLNRAATSFSSHVSGNYRAIEKLGDLYMEGKLVPKDEKRGYAYYRSLYDEHPNQPYFPRAEDSSLYRLAKADFYAQGTTKRLEEALSICESALENIVYFENWNAKQNGFKKENPWHQPFLKLKQKIEEELGPSDFGDFEI